MARWPLGWLLLLLLPACVATAPPPSPVFLKAAGSTSEAPLFNSLAAVYQAENPHLTFDLEGGGSELGYQLAATSQVDFGLVSRPPENIDPQLQVVPVGRDAIALIVHSRNPVGDFSTENLRQIFNGRYFNWQTVGGPDLPIQVISREDGSGTRLTFEAQVMDGLPVTPTAIVLPNSQAVVDFVAEHPEAVAYVSLAFVTPAVRTVAVEGVTPSLESLNNNSYLLRRELALVVQQPLRPEVEQFVQFALSPAGQQLVGQRWGRVR